MDTAHQPGALPPFDDLLTGLRAAAEPTRLRLLALCALAELTVTDLTEILGQSQPRVSRHLKLLCTAGLMVRVREGNNAYYRTARHGPAAALASGIDGLIDRDDDALSTYVRRLEQLRHERAEAAAAYFRRNARQWDAIRSLHVDEAEVEAALLGAVPEGPIDDYLDIGTGTGRVLELVAPRVARGVGLDQSREMLALARARLDHAGLAHCEVRQGDMYVLPWPADSFDLITVHQVLHYAEKPAAAIAEAARVLRPGGRLVVVDFAPHDLDHLRREYAHRRLGLDQDEVEDWLGAAGLVAAGHRDLPGTSLTVVVWTADRPDAARRGAAA